MSALDPMFIAQKDNSERTIENALVWHGLPSGTPDPLPLRSFSWTQQAKAIFDRILHSAKETGKPEGKQIPYADLRAAMQARIPDLVLLNARLLPNGWDTNPTFASNGEAEAVVAKAHRAVGIWTQVTLRPWSERLAIDCSDIDFLEAKSEKRELFHETERTVLPAAGVLPDPLGDGFRDNRDAILALAASTLDGTELFPGLGPVHRILDREYGNAIAFETWPQEGPRGEDLFSMVADLSVETRPSSHLPILVVRASKRIWCREFPGKNALYGRSRITVRAIVRAEQTIAVSLEINLFGGEPKDDLDAMIFEASRAGDVSLSKNVVELVRNRGQMPNVFVGTPFRYGYRPTPRIHPGVTLQDQRISSAPFLPGSTDWALHRPVCVSLAATPHVPRGRTSRRRLPTS